MIAKHIDLDWTRLLGFDQATSSEQDAVCGAAKVGSKDPVVKFDVVNLGAKIGPKDARGFKSLLCAKVGEKNPFVGDAGPAFGRIGAKIGFKDTIRGADL